MNGTNSKLLKNISKKIAISTIIFLIFPLFSHKINSHPFFSSSLFAQSSEQVDPFYEKLFLDGKYFYNNANYLEAIEHLEIAYFGFLDNESKLLECYIYLTACHYELKEIEKSQYYYNKIKTLKLENYLKDVNLSPDLLIKYYEITSYLSIIESKAKSSSSGHSLTQSEMESEIKNLKKDIKKGKNATEPYFTLSEIYLKQNKKKDAKEILEDLLEVDNKNGRAYLEIGKIFVLEKKYQEAIKQFQKALQYLKDNVELHYQIGRAYFELKDFEKSKQEFKIVHNMNNSYKDTERYLILLEKILKTKSH